MQTFKNSSKDQEILEKLKEVSFFSIFAEDTEIIKKISSICSNKSFKSGKNIIKEGDPGDELYIILKGEIEIQKNTLQNEQYTVTTLSSDKGVINVGELALIDNDKRSASVVAKTDCDCIVINRKDFVKFGDDNPKVGLGITRVIAGQLSSKLRKSNTDVITLFSALVEEISGE